MIKKTHRLRLLVLAAAIAVTGSTLVACAPDSGGSAGGDTPVAGGTLTVGAADEPASLDPVALSGSGEIAVNLVYDSLVRRYEFGQEPQPNVAESLTPNDDLTEWTIVLRDGVTFSDGTPLDAEAVKANIDRHIAPDSTSAIKGTLSLVQDVEVVDDKTVLIKLSGPWANLAYSLTFPLASPTAIEELGDTFGQNPVGSGPYVLTEWVQGDHMTFERRDDYWGLEAGREGSYLDAVTVRLIPNETTRNTALARGEIDIALVASNDTMRAALDGNGDVVASIAPPGAAPGWIIPFNLSDPVTSDPRVREALAYSIDREELLNLDAGLTEPNPGPFAGTVWDNDIQYPGFDLERAQAAADAYTAENGPITLSLSIYTDPTAEKYAQALQAMWKEIGVETEIVEADFGATIGAVLSGDYQALLTKSGFISPHPDFILPIFMSSNGGLLFTHTPDPEIDAALDAARVTTDVDQQREAYKVIDEKFADDVIWIWLNTGVQGITHRACVKGSALDGAALTNTGVPDLSRQIWTTCAAS